MSFSTASADAYLRHVGGNEAWANLGDAAGLQPSAAAGSVYASFHTSDLLAGSTAATNEATDLARQAIARAIVASGSNGFTAPEAGTVANSRRIRNAQILEVTNTGGGSITVQSVALTLAAAGASQILLADTSRADVIPAGGIFRYAIGALSFQVLTLPLS